jgi:uncharacterized protein
MRAGFRSKRAALFVLGAVGVASACTRTPDPVEHFQSRSTGPSGGGSRSQSGAGSVPGAGTSSPGEGGTEAAGGEVSVDAGGQGGDSTGVPEPPTDLGCGDAPVSSGAFTKKALRAAAAECAQWHYCRFEAGARELADELNDYLAAPTADGLARARAAHATAFALASQNELFQFGPFASPSESSAKDKYQGRGLRELIYAWPQSARCGVEEQLVTRAYAQSFDRVRLNARGLFALDYLLHYPGSDTECTPTSATGQAWTAWTEEDLAAAKAEYAAALGDDVLLRAQELREAWAPDGGDFTPVFVDTTGYPSELETMKVLAWSLLYVERDVKDLKLGLPAGYTAPGTVSVAEAAFSGLKVEAIRENLRGFRGLFQGCGPDGAGLGFDDWLTDQKHGELADEIIQAYVAAQAAADDAPALDQMTPAELDALYQAVKRLTDLLKNDLFGGGSPLNLTLPPGLEGDTD